MSKIIYTKPVLEEAVASSKTFTETFRKLGARLGGNTYQRVRSLIEHHQIDTSHFYSREMAGMMTAGIGEAKPWQERLVDGYTRRLRSKDIRNALKQSGRPYCCEKCGQKPEWQGESLTLHVDHIDGNWRDCRPENLRFLCPNCHSQAETSCNQGRGKRCKNCQKKVTSKSTFCRRCSNICIPRERKIKDRPSLETLLSDVKELGFCGTGRKYGVTDNAIRKWIKMAEDKPIERHNPQSYPPHKKDQQKKVSDREFTTDKDSKNPPPVKKDK